MGSATWPEQEGGAGTIESIASADGSITVTDPTGPDVDLSAVSCDFNQPFPSAVRIVRLASFSNLDLNGAETIDSVATANGDRILVAGQTVASQNGIWIVAAGAWTRATDFPAGTGGEVEAGTAIYVTSGTIYRYSTWKITNIGAIDVGTTSLVIKPVSMDFDTTVANAGTRAEIGVKFLSILSNGTSSGWAGFFGAFGTNTARLESIASGIFMGGVNYKSLAATGAWMALHGGQGKPTGVPANIGESTGAVAMRYDVTNGKFYSYSQETVGAVTAAWHCSGAFYNHLKRGTNLTDADQTLQPVTDTASEYMRFTAITANRNTTLGVTSTFAGQSVCITRADGAAFTNAIINGGGGAGTLFTFASGQGTPTAPVRAWFKSDATNWALDKVEYVEA